MLLKRGDTCGDGIVLSRRRVGGLVGGQEKW